MAVIILNPIECVKVTKTYADFSAAALTVDIEAMSLFAGCILHGIKIKHSGIFSGTGITGCTLSIGIAGNLTKYATAFSVASAVSSTNYQLTQLFAGEDHLAATSLRAAMVSTGANLDQLTTGSVDMWFYYSKAR